MSDGVSLLFTSHFKTGLWISMYNAKYTFTVTVSEDQLTVTAVAVVSNIVLIQDVIHCLDVEGNVYKLKEYNTVSSKEDGNGSWKLVKMTKLDNVVCLECLKCGFLLVKRIYGNHHALCCYAINENWKNVKKKFSLRLPPIVENMRCVLVTSARQHVPEVPIFSSEVALVGIGNALYRVNMESSNPKLQLLYQGVQQVNSVHCQKDYIIIVFDMGIVVWLRWNEKNYYSQCCLPCFPLCTVVIGSSMFCTDGVDLWQCTFAADSLNKMAPISSELLAVKGVNVLHYIEELHCLISSNEYGDFYITDVNKKTLHKRSVKAAHLVSSVPGTSSNLLWSVLNDCHILWRNINLELSSENMKLNSIALQSVFQISVHASSFLFCSMKPLLTDNYILHIEIKNASKKDFTSTYWKMRLSVRTDNGHIIHSVVVPVNLKKDCSVTVVIPVKVSDFLTPSKLKCSLLLNSETCRTEMLHHFIFCGFDVTLIDISYFLIPKNILSPAMYSHNFPRHIEDKECVLKFDHDLNTFLTSLMTANFHLPTYFVCDSISRLRNAENRELEFYAGTKSVNLSINSDGHTLNITGKDVQIVHSVKNLFIMASNLKKKKISKVFFEKAWVILQDLDEENDNFDEVKSQVEEWRKHITQWLIVEK